MTAETLDTYNKALAINLDATIFGTFAEIGAGQETARWFLRVGAASGTVAKTISAYDKVVSDDLYGSGSRYVSKQRLEAMLNTEWSHLQEQLVDRLGNTKTFVFANTVSARNYAGTNQCHGWLGLRFIREPGAEASDILLHVNLRDQTNPLQQEALGILGVNLIYESYFRFGEPHQFIVDIGQDVGLERIEVDFVETKGPLFRETDQKHLLIELVAGGLSEGVVLAPAGGYLPMNEVFYKRAVVVEPGRFEEREPIHTEMLAVALEHADSEQAKGSKGALGIFCLSANAAGDAAAPLLIPPELLMRANSLLAEGFDVLVTAHRDLYKISALVSRFTTEEVRFVVGLSVLIKALADSYSELQGRVLEGLSRLFTQHVRVYVYPMALDVLQTKLTAGQWADWKIDSTSELVEAGEIIPPPPLGHLYAYLLASGLIEPLRKAEAKTRSAAR